MIHLGLTNGPISCLQDMMYLGTGHPEHGADMNGGQAGFMRSLADGQFLAWPDYVGKLGVVTVARSVKIAKI